MFPTVLRDEGFDSTTQESIFMVGGALPTQTGSVRAHNFRSTTSDVLLKDNTSGTSNTRATFNSTKSIINSSLELDSGATTNLLVLKNSAGTNTIQVDTLNQLSFLNGTNNWLISNGNITTIKSNVYIGDTSSTSKTLTIDCPAASGIPVLQLKCRNVSTTEVSLTNATWLFASKTNNLDIIFQTKNNSGTTSNVMTIDGGDAQVSFVNSIIVGGTTITSDRTLKDNIQDVSVDDCLHIFNNLKVKSFDWKRTGRPSLGFIAQEVEEILPQSNHYDIVSESKYQPTPDDEPMMIKTVDYTKLNTMLYVVIKEQQKRIDSLETRLANIEKLLCDTMNI
jgi:hypothetical protein